jgi:hypothetical protein
VNPNEKLTKRIITPALMRSENSSYVIPPPSTVSPRERLNRQLKGVWQPPYQKYPAIAGLKVEAS